MLPLVVFGDIARQQLHLLFLAPVISRPVIIVIDGLF